MTLDQLVGKSVTFRGAVWFVYNGGYMHQTACYLVREVEVRGSSHPSGYRYAHTRMLSCYLPRNTPVENGVVRYLDKSR
jgi:hypothetical protein